MPCLLVLLGAAFPRFILVMTWLFSRTLERAYPNFLIPLAGFFFLPVTTLAYAWMINTDMRIEGFNVALLIIAVLLDAGSSRGGARYYKRRQ